MVSKIGLPLGRSQRLSWKVQLLCCSALAVAVAVVDRAHAQDVPPDPKVVSASDSKASERDIIVTGSRISRSGFEAMTPTTVVGAEDLEQSAAANPADLLNTLPAFRASTTPTVTTVSQEVGANYLDLRGLGISRTLTLVNGQRYAPSNITGQVDLNMIPTIMIQRIDVVTGGASAAYGSDAVAGVVNLIYKQKVEGTEGSIQYGVSRYGDNQEINVEILHGTSFADGRGHFMIGGQYVRNRGTDNLNSRDWGRGDWNIIPNPLATPTNAEPFRLLVSNVHNSTVAYGGVINAPGALRGIQFDESGAPVPFIFGDLVGSTYQVGGSGLNPQRFVLMSPPITRYSVAARAEFEFTPSLKLSGEFSYGHQQLTSITGQPQDFGITVFQDNAYLPVSIRDALIATGSPTLTLGRRSVDLFPYYKEYGGPIRGETSLYRGVVRLDGDLGGTWHWDAYYEKGTSTNIQEIGLRINDNWARAIDAVRDPGTGAIVCRSTLSSDPAVRAAAAGCTPFNMFGVNTRSEEAADYVSGISWNKLRYDQDVFAASMQGEPFSLPAGPVSVAFGAEYRRERAKSQVDDISLARRFAFINVQPIDGVSEVKEAFLETIVPILADMPGAESLDFNGAVRYTDYSLSGAVTTWKVGLNYEPVKGLRFRATRSRDIRAPNLRELYSPLQGSVQVIFDPSNNNTTTPEVQNGGNLTLTPEKANTTTFGVVLSPVGVPGFQASVDYFDIEIADGITTLSAQDIVGRCFAGAADLCSRITRNSSGAIVRIDRLFENLGVLRNRGVDFELSYQRPVGAGTLGLRVVGTYMIDVIQDDGKVAINLAGDTGGRRPGGLPDWTGKAILSYANGPLKLSANARYISSGKLDATAGPKDLNINVVPSRTYVGLGGSYEIIDTGRQRLQVFANVDNLFNTDPPIAISPAGYPTNSILFDTIGQTFKAGIRFAF